MWWMRRKPKTDVSGCLAMTFLFVIGFMGFAVLIIMSIIETIFS